MENSEIRFHNPILILFVIFCFVIPFVATAQAESVPAVSDTTAKDLPETEQETLPSQRNNIEKTGKRIGEGIEKFGKKASGHVGGWIKAEVFAGITWLKLLFSLVILFLVALVDRILQWLIKTKLGGIPEEDYDIPWGKFLFSALSKPLSLFIWIYGVYFAFSPLFVHFQTQSGTNFVQTVAQKAADIGGTVAVFWFILRLVQFIDIRLKKSVADTESAVDDMLVPLVGKTLRVFIVIIGAIIIIQNLTGMKIGPLLASLGIGGLAVALAAKESIANFLGTLTILFDKPFKVGERIVIGSNDGIVESVGFRSTRIRTLTGHLLTIPNEKIISSPLENIAKRPFIRWLANIGITYDTPPEKVEKAVQIIRDILENHEGMKEDFPPRVFFNAFNDYSLNITAMAWYHPPTYWDYQAWLQKTCLEIMKRFEAEGIEFAFPTRTVYLANDEKRQLKLQMLKGEDI